MGLEPARVVVLLEKEFEKLPINNACKSLVAYIEKEDTIYINKKYIYVWEDLQNYINELRKSGHISTNNTNHIALHELAHKEHIKKGKIAPYKFNQNEIYLIRKYISSYATTDSMNFVAEFRVLLLNDPSLINKINQMDINEPMKLLYNLYKELGGL